MRQYRPSRCAGRLLFVTGGSAFTLVELLVLIVIIGLLTALLLPALNRAKQSAYLACCANNLRQIGLATSLYVTDNGVYPGYWTNSPIGYLPSFWYGQLGPYVSDTTWKGVFHCPGAPDRLTGTTTALTYRSAGMGYGAPSDYGMNSQGTDVLTPLGIDGDWPQPPSPLPDPIPQIRESCIRAPSDLIAFGDVAIYDFTGLGESSAQMALAGSFNFPLYQMNLNLKPHLQGSRFEAQRHRGLFNVVFCDCHAEALKTDKIWGITDDVTQRWNRDHQPHTGAWK